MITYYEASSTAYIVIKDILQSPIQTTQLPSQEIFITIIAKREEEMAALPLTLRCLI